MVDRGRLHIYQQGAGHESLAAALVEVDVDPLQLAGVVPHVFS